MKKYLLSILFLGILLFPFISFAGTYKVGGADVIYKGLVPCGKSKPSQGESNLVTMPCQFCHIFVMLKGILDFLLVDVVIPVAVLMVVIGGVMFFLSSGNPGMVGKANSLLTSTVTGLVIIFGAYIFVNTFFLFIGVADWTGLRGGWFKIDCPIVSPQTYTPSPSLALASPNGSNFSANIGEEFNVNLGLNPTQPISNIDTVMNFNKDLLVLKRVIPNLEASNFKTFLPQVAGSFNEQRVINQANSSGVIRIGASCFDGQNFTSPQSSSVSSLVTFIFEAKNQGSSEIRLDSANSNLMAAIGEITSILGAQESKIGVNVL